MIRGPELLGPDGFPFAPHFNIGDLFFTFRGESEQLIADAEAAGAKAGDKGGAAAAKPFGQRLSDGLRKHSTLIAAGMGAAVGDFVTQGIGSFQRFDDSMREVFAIMPGISAEAAEQLKGDVRSISQEYGVLTDEIVPALGTAIGSGIPESGVVEFMRTATKAAKAGAADTDEAVKVIAAALNAYNLDVSEAENVSNAMFNAIDKGVITFGELSSSMAKVMPTAASMGISLEDVLSGITSMTLGGTQTAEAVTYLNNALVSLLNPSKAMEGVLASLGYESGQAAIDALGLQGAFEAIRREADASDIPLVGLTGNIRAANAMLQLTGDNAGRANEVLGTFTDTSGKVDAAFEVMEGGIGGMGRRLVAFVEDVKLTAGSMLQDLAPLFMAFGPQIGRWVGRGMGAVSGIIAASLVTPLAEGLGTALAAPTVTARVGAAAKVLGSTFGRLFGLAAAAAVVVILLEELNRVSAQVWSQWERLTEANVAEEISEGALALAEMEAQLAKVDQAIRDVRSRDMIFGGLTALGDFLGLFPSDAEVEVELLKQRQALVKGIEDVQAGMRDAAANPEARVRLFEAMDPKEQVDRLEAELDAELAGLDLTEAGEGAGETFTAGVGTGLSGLTDDEQLKAYFEALDEALDHVASTSFPNVRSAAQAARKAILAAFRDQRDPIKALMKEEKQLEQQRRRAMRRGRFDIVAMIDARKAEVQGQIADRRTVNQHYRAERNEQQNRRKLIKGIGEELGLTRKEARKLQRQTEEKYDIDLTAKDADLDDALTKARELHRQTQKDYSVNVKVHTTGLGRHGTVGRIISGEHRQHGGPVEAGRPYWVGEAGREIFVPRTAGHIVPNAASEAAAGTTIHLTTHGLPMHTPTPVEVVQQLRRATRMGIVPPRTRPGFAG